MNKVMTHEEQAAFDLRFAEDQANRNNDPKYFKRRIDSISEEIGTLVSYKQYVTVDGAIRALQAERDKNVTKLKEAQRRLKGKR